MAFVPIYILILAFTIVIDYFAGLLIERSQGNKRRLYLIASLVANIGVLAMFKYYNFLTSNLTHMFNGIGVKTSLPYLSILLPIGLSFHTFQAMSYTIEVYRGNQKAERHFGIYALYVMFYPQLVAGPIERPQNLLHQFYENHLFEYQRITDGLKLMAWGLFKKMVIADRLAVVVDNVYNNPHDHQGLSLIIATVFFSFQIFCDFSGYSDIAIGAAQVMGFTLMKNFERPYHSKSISEFWKRWHISLSTWFRDYFYISLGGNRVPVPRWYFNIFVVFLVSGLWHGANWTFVIWGVLNGAYLILGLLTKDIRTKVAGMLGLNRFPRLQNILQIGTTFSLITFAWIFFRARNYREAFYIVRSSISGLREDVFQVLHGGSFHLTLGVPNADLLLGICAILFMECIHIMQTKTNIREWLRARPLYVRWGMYYVALFFIVFLGAGNVRQFIYFQF